MIRKIIRIDESKCNGCGLCANACHEGAIEVVNGKAKLLRENFCDGFGDCLPHCPEGAISFEEREAPAYDAEAVRLSLETGKDHESKTAIPCELNNWPCQLKLAPVKAGYYDGASLLVAADCCAYAYAGIHNDFMKGRVTLIGCPKLDGTDYSEKLRAILENNDIRDITVLRMEVPCCGGIEYMTNKAVEASGRNIPLDVVTVMTDGSVE